MAVQKESPFVCHVFICTHDREGKKMSCADYESTRIRDILKEEVGSRGWKGRVRVSQSGCLGLCKDDAPNVLLYPQRIWFSGVSADDARLIIAKIEEILGDKT